MGFFHNKLNTSPNISFNQARSLNIDFSSRDVLFLPRKNYRSNIFVKFSSK